ncbi:NOL6 protein, partial [Polypterus senegalus]
MAAVFWNPLTVFVKPKVLSEEGPITHSYRANACVSPQAELLHLIPHIYQCMRRSYQVPKEEGESPKDVYYQPTVEAFGLGTVYSAPMLLILVLFQLLLALLHPEGLALSFLLMLLEAFAILQIHSTTSSLHCSRLYSDQHTLGLWTVASLEDALGLRDKGLTLDELWSAREMVAENHAVFSIGDGDLGMHIAYHYIVTGDSRSIEIEELLKEVILSEEKRKKIDLFVQEVTTLLSSVPETKFTEIADQSWLPPGIKVPLLQIPFTVKGRFRMAPPRSLNVVGSYPLGTCTKPDVNVDLAVTMPPSPGYRHLTYDLRTRPQLRHMRLSNCRSIIIGLGMLQAVAGGGRFHCSRSVVSVGRLTVASGDPWSIVTGATAIAHVQDDGSLPSPLCRRSYCS